MRSCPSSGKSRSSGGPSARPVSAMRTAWRASHPRRDAEFLGHLGNVAIERQTAHLRLTVDVLADRIQKKQHRSRAQPLQTSSAGIVQSSARRSAMSGRTSSSVCMRSALTLAGTYRSHVRSGQPAARLSKIPNADAACNLCDNCAIGNPLHR